MKMLDPGVARVLKRLHYPLSLRHLEKMMAERGIAVDHSTVHRWAIKLLPVLEKGFRRCKRAVGKSWRVLVQIAGVADISPINRVTLFIEQNRIPD